MKVLMVSDVYEMLGRRLEKNVQDFFSNESLSCFNAKEANIGYCIGCFFCRVKSPGKCFIQDDMDDILRAYVDCDLFIILTKMQFGVYSSPIKCLLDRTIPLENPFLRIAKGEVHLQPRYPKERKLMVIAYGEKIDPDDGLVFRKLVERNAINFDMINYKMIFCEEQENLMQKIERVWENF